MQIHGQKYEHCDLHYKPVQCSTLYGCGICTIECRTFTTLATKPHLGVRRSFYESAGLCTNSTLYISITSQIRDLSAFCLQLYSSKTYSVKLIIPYIPCGAVNTVVQLPHQQRDQPSSTDTFSDPMPPVSTLLFLTFYTDLCEMAHKKPKINVH